MRLIPAAKAVLRPYRRPLFEAFGSDRYSFLALDNLDRKLKRHIDYRDGFFIEAGANDGIAFSNSYWFERFRGWRGILIEPIPENAALCRRNRPRAITVNCALVGDDETKTVNVHTAGLMGYVAGSFASAEAESLHREHAQRLQDLPSGVHEIEVPARTLSSILDEQRVTKIDLFSLDVEGYEMEVLRGLDLERHRPNFLLVETARPTEVCALLGGRYGLVEQMSGHDYLFRDYEAM